jgi:hypothetical protein
VLRALAIVIVLASAARADDLDQARKLEASLEYEKALTQVEASISSGHHDARSLASVELVAGKLAAGLDRAADAAVHYARALELDPTLHLSPAESPKILAPYDKARAHTRPLAIGVSRSGRRLTVTVVSDTANIVRVARTRSRDGSPDQHLDRPPFTFELPPDGLDVAIEVTDEHGNVVFADDGAGARVLASPEIRDRGWRRARPAVFAAGGAALVAALCIWRFEVAQSDWDALHDSTTAHDYSTLRAIEDRGRSWALGANVSMGVAGAAALVALALWITADGYYPVGISATPTSLGVAGRF